MNLGLDFVTTIPPCAGLSMLNTSTTKGIGRGFDSVKNEWISKSFEKNHQNIFQNYDDFENFRCLAQVVSICIFNLKQPPLTQI